MLEFQQFNQLWDKRMAEYEQKSADLVETMRERHAATLNDYLRQLQGEPLKRPKFSKELLNLRRIQQTLAKQKEYAEAHKVKLKGDNLEAFELEKLRNMHQVREESLTPNPTPPQPDPQTPNPKPQTPNPKPHPNLTYCIQGEDADAGREV
jgi:hypothetical protein